MQLSQSEIETMFQELRSNTTTTAEQVRPVRKDGDPGKSSRFTRHDTKERRGLSRSSHGTFMTAQPW